MLGSPTRALNELVSEERERVIELLAALTASSDLVEQQRCQIGDLKDALQARVRARACSKLPLRGLQQAAPQGCSPLIGAGLVYSLPRRAAPLC